jgi:hypothetical protein
MNAANRVVNRLVLFLSGIVLLGVAAAAALQSASVADVAPAWWSDAKTSVEEGWAAAAGGTVTIPGAASFVILPVIAVAVVVAMLVIALVILATRRRGHTRNVMDVNADAGRTVVDREVADAVLCAPLLDRPDVVSARADGYLIRGRNVVGLAVRVQPGAALDSVLTTAHASIAEWDSLRGERQPVVVHLSDRAWRDALRAKTRL